MRWKKGGGGGRKVKDLGKVSNELYRWLRLNTEDETKLVVLAEEDEDDGINILGVLTCENTTKEPCQG